MTDPRPENDYVFGYGSLVALRAPLLLAGHSIAALTGRLDGFRRAWGAAMNNWEAADSDKHFLDPRDGSRPRIRVAYLDIAERHGSTLNGLAIPVDPVRLAELDAREVNYDRIEVSSGFRPAVPGRVFAYRATEAARERCRQGAEDGDVCVSREYLTRVRSAFSELGPGSLPEFERTTDPLVFPVRDLELVQPPSRADGISGS